MLHQTQIMVGRDRGQRQHLIQHIAMLPGHQDTAVKARIARQFMQQGEQLDRFGPGPKHGQDLARWPHAMGCISNRRAGPAPIARRGVKTL